MSYYSEHRQARLRYQATYRRKDLGRQKRKYQEEREKRLIYQREYYEAHKEELCLREWKRWNKERAGIANVEYDDTITPALVYLKHLGICAVCRTRVAKDKVTVDHIIPISRGGSHTWNNVQLVHRSCNQGKYDSDG